MPYTIDFHDMRDEVDHFAIVYCLDDGQAAEIARRALASCRRAARVSLWRQDQYVSSFARGDTQAAHAQ